MLPVTPMTSGEKRRRQAAATRWRPSRVSARRSRTRPRAPARRSRPKLRHEKRGGAVRQGGSDEPMAVSPLARKSDEEVPRSDQTRVDGDAGYRSCAGKDKLATGDGGYLGGGQGNRPRSGRDSGWRASVTLPVSHSQPCSVPDAAVTPPASLSCSWGRRPVGLGGIRSVVTASVAIRRNSS